MSDSTILMNADEMNRVLDRLAEGLLAAHALCDNLALIGIQRRGVIIAEELARRMGAKLGSPVPLGSLDITLYRDDWSTLSGKPSVRKTHISFDVEGRTLVLVDDVLFTGRTVRAALEALADFGRPGKVELLVLVDRGHRELPIHADYAGLSVETRKKDHVDVLVTAIDGENSVRLIPAP